MPAPIYRAPMRARARDDVPLGEGARHGLARGLVATGDALEAPPASLEDALDGARARHGDKAARMLRAFAELPDGTFVWTRDGEGAFWLGRIAGPWFYDDSPAAREVGLHHARAARWLERPFGDDEVPGAVAATFARGGRNLQRTHDPRAEAQTAELWRQAAT